MANVPTGTKFFIATGLAAVSPQAFTNANISNAAEAVIQLANHGFVDGDVAFVSSGWGGLNSRVFEVTRIDANSLKLNKADTSNTQTFPTGSGGGSLKKIGSGNFVQIVKTMNPQSSGGEAKSVTYKFVDSDVEYSINDGFTATSYTLEMDDDDTTAGYAALRSLTDVQSDTVLKMLLRNGSRLYIPCRAALNDVPQMQDGQINRMRAAFNGIARHTRYSA